MRRENTRPALLLIAPCEELPSQTNRQPRGRYWPAAGAVTAAGLYSVGAGAVAVAGLVVAVDGAPAGDANSWSITERTASPAECRLTASSKGAAAFEWRIKLD